MVCRVAACSWMGGMFGCGIAERPSKRIAMDQHRMDGRVRDLGRMRSRDTPELR